MIATGSDEPEKFVSCVGLCRLVERIDAINHLALGASRAALTSVY